MKKRLLIEEIHKLSVFKMLIWVVVMTGLGLFKRDP